MDPYVFFTSVAVIAIIGAVVTSVDWKTLSRRRPDEPPS